MASEDVLERSYKWLAGESFEHIPFLIADLAAEVRELREDKARLDRIFASKYACISVKGPYDWNPVDNREELDAAMGATENG